MSKKADNAVQANYLRTLMKVVNDGALYDIEHARAHVMFALEDLADVLDGKPKKKGATPKVFLPEQHFLQLATLLFREQTQTWQQKKGMPEADRKVHVLTGWKLPRRSGNYTWRENLFKTAVERMDEAALLRCKEQAVKTVPADKRNDVAFAIGLRKK